MHEPTEYPEPYVTIIAMVKFNDVPAFPACGYLARTSDSDEPYLAVFVPRTGYAWELVAGWDYLNIVAPDYSIPVKEERK